MPPGGRGRCSLGSGGGRISDRSWAGGGDRGAETETETETGRRGWGRRRRWKNVGDSTRTGNEPGIEPEAGMDMKMETMTMTVAERETKTETVTEEKTGAETEI